MAKNEKMQKYGKGWKGGKREEVLLSIRNIINSEICYTRTTANLQQHKQINWEQRRKKAMR